MKGCLIVMQENIVFHDPRRAPFEIFGLYNPGSDDGVYRRLPDEVAKSVSSGVASLYLNTAGGRIRFATDSETIIIRAKTAERVPMHHCTPLMEGGFDIYLDGEGASRFLGSFKFDTRSSVDYEASLRLGAGMKQLTLNMPLYGSVTGLSIGLSEGAVLTAHAPYRHPVPIVFYGSSITQGACASRPGLCYQAYISRRFDCDYINLGFSGNARGEESIARYMAELKMSAFVSDYDHNAPDTRHLKDTHNRLYRIIRDSHPDIPYFMISRPDFNFDSREDIERRAIIMESYLDAYRSGDNNVWFIDGSAFFSFDARGECTIDGCHPTDLGFYRMAEVIGDAISNVLFSQDPFL